MNEIRNQDYEGTIAIVGMAGRFPKAHSVAELWKLLRNGEEGITTFSKEELVAAGVPGSLVDRDNYVKSGGYLEAAEDFESELFGYSHRDAQVIDPQQRLLLECCFEALADAALDPHKFPGLVGTFAAVGMNAWMNRLYADRNVVENVSGYQLMISNDKDYAATRVSYQLNLQGPSIGIQTACSSSLVAVAMACQSLASGECDAALAAAASLMFPRRSGYLYEDGMILSPDGHCRTFDAKAQGTVPGEGVAALLLKRTEDALEAGDHIEAVIRGWAVNNDGRNKIGFTAPSIQGQAQVIKDAISFAGISAESIGYVEAHGTATPLGDPIEIAALCDAFSSRTSRLRYCSIGSVKSNLGHLDTAAGIAGLIKAVLCLKHREIPPTLHFERPNPEIDFENSPFVVADKLKDWGSDDSPRRAGVSSFGIGGTNCHVILEEYPSRVSIKESSSVPQLLVWSAASPQSATQFQEMLAASLEADKPSDMSAVAFTLQSRIALKHRRAIIAKDRDEAITNLRNAGSGQMIANERRDEPRHILFMFPGQGSQFPAMGVELYEALPVFRATLDQCADLLRLRCGWQRDLRDICFAESNDANRSFLNRTDIAQPALFAISYALARQWIDLNVVPDLLLGHSVGEYVAACVGGVLEFEDALRIVARRGWLMSRTDPGAMLAVAWTSPDPIESFLDGRVEIAARNATDEFVLSGSEMLISNIAAELESHDVAVARLATSHAFHSASMDSVVGEFQAYISKFNWNPPNRRIASTISGTWLTDDQAIDPSFWAKGIRSCVRFDEAMTTALGGDSVTGIEVGPERVLQSLARRNQKPSHEFHASMRSRTATQNDHHAFLDVVGRLWATGADVQFSRLHDGSVRQRVSLPTYAFQRRTFSIGATELSKQSTASTSRIKKQPVSDWFYSPQWQRSAMITSALTPSNDSELWLIFSDHRGVGKDIGRRLQAQGHDVVYVVRGDAFEQRSESEFVVQSRLYGNYSRLIEQLSSPTRVLTNVLHCWLVDERSDHDSFESVQGDGFYSLLFLCQALGRRSVPETVHIKVVTSQVQEVLGDESICPAKATIYAPILVASQEYPHLHIRHIDIQTDADTNSRSLELLYREVRSNTPATEIALRGRHLWQRSYQRVALSDSTRPLAEGKGAWIVIGGFGQIGLTMASWVAHVRQSPVVIVSRQPFPNENQWESWLAENDLNDPTAERIRAVLQLRESGVEVVVHQADVADLEAMRAVARRTIQRFGRIAGMVHSAGIVEHRIIHYTSPSDCERQFRAKVDGIETLAALALEFLIPKCFINSSLSSVLGGLGFCSYAASNLYLDAYVDRLNRDSSTQWMIVNWDGWTFPNVAEYYSEDDPVLELTLTAEQGFQCMNRLDALSQGRRIVVSTGDLDARLDAWVNRPAIETRSPAGPSSDEVVMHPRPNLSVPFEPPTTDTEIVIAEVWRQMLGVDKIGVHDDYIELGGHSLLAGQIIGRLRERLKASLSIRALFEFPTVSKLAMHVAAMRLTYDSDDPSDERISVEL
ncbi:MAG: SDR family oxidoreductase [Pirellulaceae bacterium]